MEIKTDDLTYTNVGPALWNMVESEIGFVAANMLCMGPLFGKIRAQGPKIRRLYAKNPAVSESARSMKFAMDRRCTIGGSGSMNNNAMGGGSQTTTVGRLHDNKYTEEAWPMDAISLRTNNERRSEEVVS